MFQSLNDTQPHTSPKEWAVRLSIIAAISALLFVALYFGVRSAAG